MTTTLVAQPPEVEAPERGTTTVADRVVAAVAGRAASEVPGVGGAARRLMGVAVESAGAHHAPQVEVTVAGETVALHIRLSIAYPAPVRATAERVRQHVAERVEVLAGKKVGVVDVTVVALPLPAVPARVVR